MVRQHIIQRTYASGKYTQINGQLSSKVNNFVTLGSINNE